MTPGAFAGFPVGETTRLLSAEETLDALIARVNRIRATTYDPALSPDERRALQERLAVWRARLAARLAERLR